jgi:hypothetical protein
MKHDTHPFNFTSSLYDYRRDRVLPVVQTDGQLALEKEGNFVRKKLRNQCYELKILLEFVVA